MPTVRIIIDEHCDYYYYCYYYKPIWFCALIQGMLRVLTSRTELFAENQFPLMYKATKMQNLYKWEWMNQNYCLSNNNLQCVVLFRRTPVASLLMHCSQLPADGSTVCECIAINAVCLHVMHSFHVALLQHNQLGSADHKITRAASRPVACYMSYTAVSVFTSST